MMRREIMRKRNRNTCLEHETRYKRCSMNSRKYGINKRGFGSTASRCSSDSPSQLSTRAPTTAVPKQTVKKACELKSAMLRAEALRECSASPRWSAQLANLCRSECWRANRLRNRADRTRLVCRSSSRRCTIDPRDSPCSGSLRRIGRTRTCSHGTPKSHPRNHSPVPAKVQVDSPRCERGLAECP